MLLLPVRFWFIHISLNLPVASCDAVLVGSGARKAILERRGELVLTEDVESTQT